MHTEKYLNYVALFYLKAQNDLISEDVYDCLIEIKCPWLVQDIVLIA